MSEVKYVLYRRLSKKANKVQHGFDSQLRDQEYFLESQESYKIIGDFQEFVGGGADIKPQLELAMDLCRKEGAVLLLSKVDRLSRRISQVSQYLEGDVKFRIACMPQADNFQIAIYSILAEQEREFIRDRVRKGLAAARRKGIKLGGASDTWKKSYKANKANHSKPAFIQKSRDDAQPIVKEITNIIKYSRGAVTQDQIASHLTSAGIKTPRGSEFTRATVSRMIKKFGIQYENKNKYDGLSS